MEIVVVCTLQRSLFAPQSFNYFSCHAESFQSSRLEVFDTGFLHMERFYVFDRSASLILQMFFKFSCDIPGYFQWKCHVDWKWSNHQQWRFDDCLYFHLKEPRVFGFTMVLLIIQSKVYNNSEYSILYTRNAYYYDNMTIMSIEKEILYLQFFQQHEMKI